MKSKKPSKTGKAQAGQIRAGAMAAVLTVFAAAGCAVSGERVTDTEVIDEARGPLTASEVETVTEFLTDSQRGSATELVTTGSGVLALFENEVVSFGVDPVAEAWSYEISGPVRDVSIGPSGETILLRRDAGLGPVDRERSMLLDSSDGRVIESYTAWGEAASGAGHLLREVWVTAEPEGILVARRLSDGDVAWQHDLTETCSSGSADDIDLASAGIQLLVAYTCVEDGSAHATMIADHTGDPFWEESWADTPAPQVHVVHEHTVPGGPDDPISRMLNEELSGGFLFVYGSELDGVEPFLPEPWRSAPGVGDYAEEPLQDLREAPQEIILHSSPRGKMNDLLVVQAARWLAGDNGVPFTKEDIDGSLMIDDELVQNPNQWSTGQSGYVSALTEELAEAFP
ncbi:hypothetical protein [Nocardiopsis alkaliphila]|uniref:hypothetical protein n=1 Tax=Nocardiopsis alkaliphila TaxID=225762 RepID=UPI000380F565|nr:hypothetical protein [Nocardiopsis alkaliphila]